MLSKQLFLPSKVNESRALAAMPARGPLPTLRACPRVALQFKGPREHFPLSEHLLAHCPGDWHKPCSRHANALCQSPRFCTILTRFLGAGKQQSTGQQLSLSSLRPQDLTAHSAMQESCCHSYRTNKIRQGSLNGQVSDKSTSLIFFRVQDDPSLILKSWELAFFPAEVGD